MTTPYDVGVAYSHQIRILRIKCWLNAVERTWPQPGVVKNDRKLSEKRLKTGLGLPGAAGVHCNCLITMDG
jgi:hypothetical protein